MKPLVGAVGTNKVIAMKKLPLAIALALASINAYATAISGGETISADDASGLDLGTGGTVSVTIDSAAEGDGLTLGAGPSMVGTPAVTASNLPYALTLNVQHSGTGNGVVFAGDVISNATTPFDNITINALNDDVTFQGNVLGAPFAFAPIDINLGDGGSATLSMTVDTVNAESLLIDATIDAVNAGDTVTLNIANTDGGMNGVGFGRAIGAAGALDAINIGDATNVTFNSTVNVGGGNINFDGSGAAAFAGDVTGNIAFAAGSTSQAFFGSNAGLTGDVSSAVAGEGALFFDPAFSNTTLVSGDVGSVANEVGSLNVATSFSNGVVSTFGGRVDAQTINIVGGAGTVRFSDIVDATTINVGGAGTTNFQGNVTGDIEFSTGNSAKVTVAGDSFIDGDVTTATSGTGTLSFAAPSGDLTLITGNIGSGAALSAVNIGTASGFTSTLGGAVRANSITINGNGTAAFSNQVTGNLRFGGDAVAEVDANRRIVGSVSTASDGQGSLEFGQTTADVVLVSGSVGSASAALKSVDVDIASAVEATFGGGVHAKTLTVDGNSGGTAVFAGDVTAPSFNLLNDPTIKLSGSNTFVGDISTALDNTGALEIYGGSAAVDGQLGDASGNALKSITIGSGTTADQVSFSDDMAAYNILVNDGATFKTTRALTAKAQTGFVNKGVLQLSDTLTLTGGGVAELGGSSTASFQLLSPTYSNGTVINASAMSSVDASNKITVVPNANFTNGSLTLVDTNAGVGTAASEAKYSVADTMSTDYSVLVDDDLDVVLNAAPRSGGADNTALVSVFGGQLNKNASILAALSQGVSSFTSDTTANNSAATKVTSARTEGSSGGSSNQSVQQSSPQGTTFAKLSGEAAGVVADEVDEIGDTTTKDEWKAIQDKAMEQSDEEQRSDQYLKDSQELFEKGIQRREEKQNGDERPSGGNGGDGLANDSGLTLWSSASFADAEKQTGNEGDHTANTESFMLGLSKSLEPTHGLMNLGVAFGYNNSHTDFDTDSSDDSDTDTYMAAVTGSHNVGDKVYQIVDWTVGAGRANTESKRLASNGLTANSEFDSDLLFGEVSYSVPMAFYGWYLLPKTALAWTNIDSDGYTESGAGSDNLKMGDSRVEILTPKQGRPIYRPIKKQSGGVTPYITGRGD
jgi:hypothetical protein